MRLKILERAEKQPDPTVYFFLRQSGDSIRVNVKIDGQDYTVGWFSPQGHFEAMYHGYDTCRCLESAGFEMENGMIRVIK